VTDTNFQRLRYTLTSDSGEKLLRYSVPFELRADFLDVIPILSQDAVVARPALLLYQSRLKSMDIVSPRVMLRLLDPSGKTVSQQELTSEADVRLALPKDGPAGEYRMQMFAHDAKGQPVELNERRFERPTTPIWLSQHDDVLDKVLPPFTPLVTTQHKNGSVNVQSFGRDYLFGDNLLPVSVISAGKHELLAGPIKLLVDGKALDGTTLSLTNTSDVRDELTAKTVDPRITAENRFWVEYDGLIFCEINLKATQAVSDIALDVPLPTKRVPYAHFASGGFGAGGGFSTKTDKPISKAFYPVVWLGDFDRGLAWFCEGGKDLQSRGAGVISIDAKEGITHLKVRLVDKLDKGQSITVRFGFMATPVKPLHPRYPLNFFAKDYLWN